MQAWPRSFPAPSARRRQLPRLPGRWAESIAQPTCSATSFAELGQGVPGTLVSKVKPTLAASGPLPSEAVVPGAARPGPRGQEGWRPPEPAAQRARSLRLGLLAGFEQAIAQDWEPRSVAQKPLEPEALGVRRRGCACAETPWTETSDQVLGVGRHPVKQRVGSPPPVVRSAGQPVGLGLIRHCSFPGGRWVRGPRLRYHLWLPGSSPEPQAESTSPRARSVASNTTNREICWVNT